MTLSIIATFVRQDKSQLPVLWVLALFTVGDVYASLCKKGAYARRVHKYERSPKARILEAFSEFAQTSRCSTGSMIGAPEQTSHSSSHCQPSLDISHPKRPRHAGLLSSFVFLTQRDR